MYLIKRALKLVLSIHTLDEVVFIVKIRIKDKKKTQRRKEEHMTEQEKLYNVYKDMGVSSNEEVMALLEWSNDKVRNMKRKLKMNGFIDYDYGKDVEILKPYREEVDTPVTFKGEIYREMLEVYMEDFRNQDTFKDRLSVGQEIRMILKHI